MPKLGWQNDEESKPSWHFGTRSSTGVQARKKKNLNIKWLVVSHSFHHALGCTTFERPTKFWSAHHNKFMSELRKDIEEGSRNKERGGWSNSPMREGQNM